MTTTALTPFGRLALAHVTGVIGDLFVTVALADSVFFSGATSAARSRVLLYLVVTMAPLAVISPVIGPLLDRSRGGRRLIMAGACFARGLVCYLMAVHLHDLALYPLAFASLALAKTQSITKNALVPGVVDDQQELVAANSRLALLSILGGTLGGPLAALVLKLADGAWVLRFAFAVFMVATVLAFLVPKAKEVAPLETVADRQALHLPSIIRAGAAMGIVRGGVGFLTFFGAFVLKSSHAPLTSFGILISASAVGNGLGTIVAPLARRKVREELVLFAAIIFPVIGLLPAARSYVTPWSLAVAAFFIAASAACARLAFDSLVQRDAHEAARGRAFARFETRFQLVWVAGGVLAVVFPPSGRAGLFVLTLIVLFAGLGYLGVVRSDVLGREPRPVGRDAVTKPELGAPPAGIAPPRVRPEEERAQGGSYHAGYAGRSGRVDPYEDSRDPRS